MNKFLSNPGREHWEVVKRILCLRFGGLAPALPALEGFTDADMAGDFDNQKSTSGSLFTVVGGAVSWQSKLQKCVALNTTEAEYIAAIKLQMRCFG